MTPEQECKNCGNYFTGSYCNQCGQKVAHRLNVPHIVHEAVHVFTHADKGIFSFVPAILIRPGELALDYVQGKRKRYFSIFQYLIIIVGFTTFIIARTDMMDTMMNTLSSADQSVNMKEIQATVVGFMKQYLNLVMFALIPAYAFFSWKLFRKKGYNYAEHFVLQVAIQAQISTYSLFLILPLTYFFSKQFPIGLMLAGFVLMFGSFTLANRQFFKVSWIQAFLKGLLTYIFAYIVQVILMAIVMIVIMLNRENSS